MIFVVLGMHKSGTTLVARALHESGIFMGQDFPSGISYTNAKYEARWVQDINDTILGADRQELSLNVTSKLIPGDGISESVRDEMMRGIQEAQSNSNHWGFKDPRTVLTYQFWREYLPEHRLVIIYRNPLEVWKRYSKFNQPLRFLLPFRTWCDYNAMIMNHARAANYDHVIVLNFERLLTRDDEWMRLQEFVDLDLLDVRDQDQSINRLYENERKSPGYRMLMALAGNEVNDIFQSLEAMRSP